MTYDSAPFGASGHIMPKNNLILFSPVARFILLMLTDFISSANTCGLQWAVHDSSHFSLL